nr:MAG TPA: hypothetical protein [Caudoviricetes sp.]
MMQPFFLRETIHSRSQLYDPSPFHLLAIFDILSVTSYECDTHPEGLKLRFRKYVVKKNGVCFAFRHVKIVRKHQCFIDGKFVLSLFFECILGNAEACCICTVFLNLSSHDTNAPQGLAIHRLPSFHNYAFVIITVRLYLTIP